MIYRSIITILLILISVIQSFSQDSKFSLDFNYPTLIDDNFVGRNFKGVIDLGLKYHFSTNKIVNLGFSVNGGLFKRPKSDRLQPMETSMIAIQPRLFTQFKMNRLQKLHPSIGLGYTLMNFNVRDFDGFNSQINASENEGGININLSLVLDVSEKIYAQIQYDFIKTKPDNGVPDVKYNTKVNIAKIGLGWRL
jgi:hypothetical protein